MAFGPVDPQLDLVALEQRVLARWRRGRAVRPGQGPAQGRAALDLLRGPADGQRQAGAPPRVGPGVQGPVPPVPDHAGPRRPPQGRLGLPRPAGGDRGREGAGPHQQAPDRGLRHRRVQRPLPPVGRALRPGLGVAHRAVRRLDRHRRRLPHPRQQLRRVGVVAGAPALGQGPALRGPPGQPLLPPLRHGAVVARAGPARRVPRRGRPGRLRPLPRGGRRGRPAGVDDHAVDADLQRGRRRRPRHRVRPGARRRGRPRHGDGRGPGGRGGQRRRALLRARPRRRPLQPAVRLPAARRRRPAGGGRRLRDHRGGLGHRPHRPRVRQRRHGRGQAPRACRCSTRSAPTARSTSGSRRGPGGPSRTPTARSSSTCTERGPARRRPGVHPLLPPLLAVRHAAASTGPRRRGSCARRTARATCWARTSASTGTPTTSSTVASATG